MNLKEYLFYSNKSVTQMAKELGITRSHLSHVANHYIKPSKKLCASIEVATNGMVTPDTIIAIPLHPKMKKSVNETA